MNSHYKTQKAAAIAAAFNNFLTHYPCECMATALPSLSTKNAI